MNTISGYDESYLFDEDRYRAVYSVSDEEKDQDNEDEEMFSDGE
ncbi:hypothetical protein [Companilactobacillus mishanensis]|nr:hypothetical protein [Companilactobacillus mishanensis]